MGNPGNGGWAAVANDFKICGAQRDSTNNRMEMVGVIQGPSTLLADRRAPGLYQHRLELHEKWHNFVDHRLEKERVAHVQRN